MTITFTTNASNDIFILPNGNLAVSSNQDAVLQACQTASKAQLGEMILATKNGIPNFQTVWDGAPNIQAFINALRLTLLGVSGVVSVTSLTAQKVGNALKYSATIESQFGTLFLNG